MTTIEKMNQQRQESQKKVWPKLVKEENLQNTFLEGKTKYSKCFYCYDAKKKDGYTPERLAEMKNLRFIKNKEIYQNQDGTFSENLNEFYRCEECGRILTVDMFVNRYCEISKNNKNFNQNTR